jgi:replicative DNA helicase
MVPWSLEAEQAVLGAMLQSPDAALQAATLLDDLLFYLPNHRRLFRAMKQLVERRVAIDHVTLAEALKEDFKSIGGYAYLSDLVDAATGAANLEAHAAIITDKAVLRQLIEVGRGIADQAQDGSASAGDLLDRLESRIFQIAQYRTTEGFTSIRSLLYPVMERIEQRQAGQMRGTPSGFKGLDDITTGFQPSDLIIVAARPSVGKTALAMNIGAHAASTGTGVALFSLEMSRESIVQRLLCAEARVDSQRVRQGTLTDDDFTALAQAGGALATYPIYIDDTPALTLLEMRSKARRLVREQQIGLVIVDYLQLMRSPAYSKDRVQEVSDISRSLKGLARELKVPVMALSQLSRASEQRGGERKPILSDLRDSGAIEQDADIVIFLHRAEMYEIMDRDGNPTEGKAELIVAKHRNGPTGHLRMRFNKASTRFETL